MLSRGGELTLKLSEQLVFGTELDSALKSALKNRKDVSAMFQSNPLNSLIDDIEEALKEKGDDMRVDGLGGRAPADDVDHADLDQENVSDLPNEIIEDLKGKDPDDKDRLQQFIDTCWRQIDTCCVFLLESPDSDTMRDALKDTIPHKMRQEVVNDPQDKKFVVMAYDLEVAGAASSHPATRQPPLRQNGDHLKTMLRAAIDALDSNAIGERDLYIMFDGGRPGNACMHAAH